MVHPFQQQMEQGIFLRSTMKVKLINIYLLAVVFAVLSGNHVMAADLQAHSVYRVTSYNLGPILDDQAVNKGRFSGKLSPLLITNNTADVLNNKYGGAVSWTDTAPYSSDTQGVAVSGQFNATGKIAIHGAFGLTRNLWSPDSIDFANKSSWEANLGVIYRLMNNLSYELHFAYMDTGDLFAERSSYSDVESIIMVSNRLTMSF